MKTPEEQDPTWELLLRSKSQQPRPSFVRDVVREVRKLESPDQANEKSGLSLFFAWFKRPAIAVPVTLGAAAALIAALTLLQPLTPSSNHAITTPSIAMVDTAPPTSLSLAEISKMADTESLITEDLAQIDSIGELVAISDPADLDDAALANLFF